jgi:O-antigen/teichoic acid export membrane protein
MSKIKRNLAANVTGRFVTVIIGIVFVPLYVRFLGIEAYGLLGAFATLQTSFAILGLGLTMTMIRETARLSAYPDRAQEARNLAKTVEICQWGIGLAVALVMLAIAPFFGNWVKSSALPRGVITQAGIVVGLMIALQWPLATYDGGLQGLERQVASSAISAFSALFRAGGSIVAMVMIAPTIQVYLSWQVVASAVQTAAAAFFFWHYLPKSPEKPRFQIQSLRGLSRFAAGMSATTLLTLGLTQGDKLLLSKLLSLENFGYYMLASVAASGLQSLVGPLFTTFFPRFSQVAAIGNRHEMAHLFHRASQVASVFIIPAAVVLALFSREIVFAWTQSRPITERTHLLVTLLVTGIACNALYHMSYALQLSSGLTRLAFYANLIALVILVPAMIIAARTAGAVGAAASWMIVNAGFVLIVVPIVLRRLLPGEQKRWYLVDVGLPLIASIAVAGGFRLLVPKAMSLPATFGILALVSATTLAAGTFATPTTRHWLVYQCGRLVPRPLHTL